MINSLSTALYNAYYSDIGGRKTLTSALPSAAVKTEESAKTGSPATIVNLSSEALSALEKDNTSRAVDSFLTNHGKDLYENTFKSLKQYPEDLATRLSDKSLSEKEISGINQKMVDREMDSFMKYARQDPPDIKKYYENYIEYLDTLSPEELKSSRYAGQREIVVEDYERIIREEGGTPDNMNSPQNPVLSLFELLKEIDFNIKDSDSFLKSYEEKISPMLNRYGKIAAHG